MKIDLPSGEWADLLEPGPGRFKAKHIRAVQRAITSTDQRMGGMAVDMSDGVLAAIIQDWSVTDDEGKVLPLPSVDFDSLDELDAEDYRVLVSHEYVEHYATRFMELAGERVSPDDAEDPASPTAPSDASGPALRAAKSPNTKTSARAGTKPRATSSGRTGGGGRRK